MRMFMISGGLLVVLLILTIVRPPVPTSLSNAGHAVGAPLWQVRSDVIGAAYGAFLSLESKQSLITENVALREEASSLRRQAFQTKLLERENVELKTMLGRKDADKKHDLLAVVLRSTDVTPYDLLIVDIGTDDGVMAGDLVTVDGDVAIGFVQEVFASTATIVLFSAPHEKTPVMIGTASSSVPAVAEGQGGGTFLALLPREVPVAQGDPVSLSTLDNTLFAQVEKVEIDPADSFMHVYFKNPVNANTLRFVTIKREYIWKPTAASAEHDQSKKQ